MSYYENEKNIIMNKFEQSLKSFSIPGVMTMS